MNSPENRDDVVKDMNRAAHARIARLTGGMSPVSMNSAFTDWWTHLAIAPGKQLELASKALEQWTTLVQHVDITRMPYRQHSEYLNSLYLKNDLAEGRYRVDGKPIALSDIRVPVFALGTQRDTVSPWTSVFKINQLVPNTDVTFCLTTGGHNVGVVNPPGPGVRRGFQLATRVVDDPYIDSQTWSTSVASQDGSWWPAWEDWLRQHASSRGELPKLCNETHPPLEDAPGGYVLIP